MYKIDLRFDFKDLKHVGSGYIVWIIIKYRVYSSQDPQEKYRELCRRTKECKEMFKKLTECNDR